MTIRILVFSAFIATCSSAVFASECKSPQEIHQSKMDKYQLPELPSLLSDCGIGGVLGDWLDLGSLNIDAGNLFCGYGLNDLGNMYGSYSGQEINLPDEINIDGQIGVEVGVGSEAEGGIFSAEGQLPNIDIEGQSNIKTDSKTPAFDFDELFKKNKKEQNQDNN